MLVALEGCDGTGKSTLAEDVAARIRQQYPGDKVHLLHAGPLKTDPYTAYLEPLKDYRPNSGVHFVLDRWHVGERIYGPLYRGRSAIDDATWVWLELKFSGLGMSTFHVTQTLDEIRQRLDARGEDFLQPEHVEHVWDAFYQELNADNSATFDRRVSPQGSNDLLVDQIVAQARLNELFIGFTPRSYVGHPDSKYLLVGDRRGGPGPYPYEGAFRPVGGNSATYLLQALYDASKNQHDELPRWQDFALINSAPDEEPDVHGAAERALAVATLGREAEKRAGKDADITRFPHPQYVRRFHNKRRDDYGQLILNNIASGEDLSKWPN